MNIELRQLSIENDIAEYNKLQDIGANENGFTNEVNGMSFEQYKEWLIQQDDYSKSQNLPENFIPQTTYFLYVDNQPIGVARIRHVLFVNVLAKCRLLGYSKTKSFVHVDNIASNKVFIKNGAVLLGVLNGTKNIYEITLD